MRLKTPSLSRETSLIRVQADKYFTAGDAAYAEVVIVGFI